MSKSTISTFQLFALIPDAETARLYLEARLWPQGPRCPVCRSCERITARTGGFYRCNACKEDFTVRTGTIFERSHVPLHKWVYAMYLLLTARKGISSMQLAKEIGITQKSAWFVLQRLREACGSDIEQAGRDRRNRRNLCRRIEANKHVNKKLRAGRGAGRQDRRSRDERAWRQGQGHADYRYRHGDDPQSDLPEPSKSARDSIPTKPPPIAAWMACSSTTRRSTTARANSSATALHQQHRKRIRGPEARPDRRLSPRQPEASWPLRR